MKKILGYLAEIIALFFMVFASAANADAPFKMTTQEYEEAPAALYITSVVDDLVINKVIFNRGNCGYSPFSPKEPVKLGFGGRQLFRSGRQCNLLEIQINTNYGNFIAKDHMIYSMEEPKPDSAQDQIAESNSGNNGIAMTCKFPNGKSVVIGKANGDWNYVFGKPDRPEMTVVGKSKFLVDIVEGRRGTTTQVRVTNGDYNYVLFSSSSLEGSEDRLGVFKGTKLVTTLQCSSPFRINYNELIELGQDEDPNTYIPF